ncbi:MAG: hypothetical protein ACRC37_02370 [Lentisphaeria bacterium]
MHNRKSMLTRISMAQSNNVPITNFGIAISEIQGVIERVLAPFPEALNAYLKAKG